VVAVLARVHFGVPAFAVLWGILVVALGMIQTALLPGDLHGLIQVLRLFVGLEGVGQAE
jgi:hypothetical protein